MPDPIISPRVLTMLEAERLKQDAEWGGSSHDDLHTAEDWCTYILHQIERMQDEQESSKKLFTLDATQNLATSRRFEWKFQERMIKIAALAIAAVETSRREYENR